MEKRYIVCMKFSPNGWGSFDHVFNVYYVATKEQNLQLKKFNYTENEHICTETNDCLLCGSNAMNIRYYKSYRATCDNNFVKFLEPDEEFVRLDDLLNFIKLQNS